MPRRGVKRHFKATKSSSGMTGVVRNAKRRKGAKAQSRQIQKVARSVKALRDNFKSSNPAGTYCLFRALAPINPPNHTPGGTGQAEPTGTPQCISVIRPTLLSSYWGNAPVTTDSNQFKLYNITLNMVMDFQSGANYYGVTRAHVFLVKMAKDSATIETDPTDGELVIRGATMNNQLYRWNDPTAVTGHQYVSLNPECVKVIKSWHPTIFQNFSGAPPNIPAATRVNQWLKMKTWRIPMGGKLYGDRKDDHTWNQMPVTEIHQEDQLYLLVFSNRPSGSNTGPAFKVDMRFTLKDGI